MAGVTLNKVHQLGLITYFLVFSYISMTTSVSLDLTELRNKFAKIKVNPRGNLWATGHFMGKKSVVDDSLLGSPGEPAINPIQVPLTSDLRELISQEVLKVALQASLQDTQWKEDTNDQDTDLMLKILEKYLRNSRD